MYCISACALTAVPAGITSLTGGKWLLLLLLLLLL
jgi:hypothetical protein